MNERASDQPDMKRAVLQKIDAIGWGIFLIWIGAAFLTDMSWGTGLIGVGFIVLAGQAARKYFQLPVEWFWLVFGLAFTLWGVLDALQLPSGETALPGGLFPVLSIVAGIALIVSAVVRKSHH